MRYWWCHFLLVISVIVVQVSAQNALTEAEIQLLVDNGFTIHVHEENNTVTLQHHGYPDHSFEGGWGNNPNTATRVYHNFNLPLKTTVATSKGCAGGLGVIGLAVSGAAFYNPYTGFGYNAVEGECNETLDSCQGHPSPDGTYHYHAIPDCLYTGDLRDKFLGVALDGYPIYGPMDASGKNWTSRDLDICHGHYYNGRYTYRATFDFPYILSCYHGEDVKMQNGPPGGENGQRPPPNGQRPPTRGRKRREALHDRNRRQDGGNQACRQTVVQNWSQETCFVVCENANRDLDNCPSRSDNSTSEPPKPTSDMPVTKLPTTKLDITSHASDTSPTSSAGTSPITSPEKNNALSPEEIRTLQESGLTVIMNANYDTITVRHGGVPDHGFEGGWGNNPNTPEEQFHSFNIPMVATVADDKGCVRLGSIGMSLSGAPFYNPYTAFGYNAVEGNCKETFDDCSGHPSGNGAYHYHRLPACLYTGNSLRNKLLGVALDGYPIYGPMDMSGKNWTSGELDKCHGHFDSFDNRYKYRITMDFPYILGCYHGEIIQRPPGRGRRDATTNVYRYRRQLPNSRQCNQEEEINWKQETCHAFCETPSKDFDDCPPASDIIYDSTTKTVNVPTTDTDIDINYSRVNVASFCVTVLVVFLLQAM